MHEAIDIESLPEISWYENYYVNRVLPRIEKDMGECSGLFSWLGEQDPQLYDRISAADNEINSLWMNQAGQESFKAACRHWYRLLMEAKKGFDVWKATKRETSVLSGRQERMALR